MTSDEATARQSSLCDYGKCIASYRGEGVMTHRDGQQFSCRFETGQLSDGTVLLLCSFPPPYPDVLNMAFVAFEGTTSEGYLVSVDGDLTEMNYLPDLPRDCSPGVWAAFFLREMSVHMATGIPPRAVHFGLTNFVFLGTEPDYKCGSRVLPLTLADTDRNLVLSVRPMKDYRKTALRMRTLKCVDVTCEVVVDVPGHADLEYLCEVVDNLCYILSVARGTKIQWVYYDQYSQAGEVVSRKHCSRVTKPYSGWATIDPRASGTTHTKDFIESAYPTLAEKARSWPRLKASIDAYLDAKAEGDFLEMRGAKLAVALEALKAALIEMPNSEAREFIIDKHDFKRDLAKPLMDAIACVLQSNHVAPDLWEQLCNEGKIKELNRTSFRRLLKYLCRHIGLHVSAEDLDLVINARNSLVHRGQFYCNTTCDEASKVCPPLGSESEEYCFLVNFLDKVFLKLLDYSGPYVNWRMPGNPVMELLE